MPKYYPKYSMEHRKKLKKKSKDDLVSIIFRSWKDYEKLIQQHIALKLALESKRNG